VLRSDRSNKNAVARLKSNIRFYWRFNQLDCICINRNWRRVRRCKKILYEGSKSARKILTNLSSNPARLEKSARLTASVSNQVTVRLNKLESIFQIGI